MMKRLSLLIFLIFLLILQTSFFGPWLPDYAAPDLILMFLVAGVAVFGFNSIWRWAVLAGLLFDFFSYARVGTHVVLYIIALYGASFVSRRLLVAERSLGIILIALFILPMTAWERWGIPFLEGRGMFHLADEPFRNLLISAAMNVILFLLALWSIRRVWRRFGPPEFKILRTGR